VREDLEHRDALAQHRADGVGDAVGAGGVGEE
jgi:hypothetical protein